MPSMKRVSVIVGSLLGIAVIGAIAFITLVQVYFGIDGRDFITVEEVAALRHKTTLPYGTNISKSPEGENWAGASTIVEKIPRIIHQTWKDENLPDRWLKVRDECLEMHSDYEYMLWTDAGSRDFIAEHYSWFLPTFDGYEYNIQRADVIRYFVLHYYGGAYLDLDIGCKRPMDPLLNFEVILPQTIPVGISNDLIFSAPRHPFMEQSIHNLVTFDHTYGTNYPTVMFSTGPMFLSAQYNLFPSVDGDHGGVRVLPKSLYGKHVKPEDGDVALFSHFYGSSWHAEDAVLVLIARKALVVMLYLCSGMAALCAVYYVYIKMFGKKQAISLPAHLAPDMDRSGSLPTSRAGTPAPLHQRRNVNHPEFAHLSAVASNAGRNVMYWVPMWYPTTSEGGRPVSPSANQRGAWSSYLPSFTSDSENPYQPVLSYSRPQSPVQDSDAMSIHSMHTIRTPAHSRRQSKHSSSEPSHPFSSDDEDIESARSTPRRRDHRDTQLPSYSKSWGSWVSSLFQPRPPSAYSTLNSPNMLKQPAVWETLPPVSPTPRRNRSSHPASDDLRVPEARQQSRPRSPFPPPEYEQSAVDQAEAGSSVEEEVDKLLHEMSPTQTLQQNFSKQ